MTRTMNRLTLGVATVALAGVFAFAPSIVPVPGSMDGAAYAKNNGNGKGGGGGGGGGKADRGGGGGKDKGDRGARGGSKSKKSAKAEKTRGKPSWAGGSKKNQTQLASADATDETGELHPSQKGRWNAANANQAALDAHMRNGNYNGTIGALTQYQLAAKAAEDYEGLSELEKSALDSFGIFEDVDIADEDLAGVLNEGAVEGDPEFEVIDGVVSCSANCPEDATELAELESNAQMAADGYVEMEQQAADEQAVDDFYTASEQRIIDMSNKPTDGIEEELLDDIAEDLGVTRPEPEEAGEEEASNGGGDSDPAGESDEDVVLFVE